MLSTLLALIFTSIICHLSRDKYMLHCFCDSWYFCLEYFFDLGVRCLTKFNLALIEDIVLGNVHTFHFFSFWNGRIRWTFLPAGITDLWAEICGALSHIYAVTGLRISATTPGMSRNVKKITTGLSHITLSRMKSSVANKHAEKVAILLKEATTMG